MLWNECWSTICQVERFEGHALLDPCCTASLAACISPHRPGILSVNACSLSAPLGRINGL